MNKVDYKDRNIQAPLIEECIKGKRKAQYMLYKQYSKAMFNLEYRMMNNREDAEDILKQSTNVTEKTNSHAL